jgi:hypothetical protein
MKDVIYGAVFIAFLCGLVYVMFVVMNVYFGPEAQNEDIKNRDYKYQVTCSVNGKTVTKYFLDCYSGQSGLRCGNSRSTSFLCQGNYSYILVPR